MPARHMPRQHPKTRHGADAGTILVGPLDAHTKCFFCLAVLHALSFCRHLPPTHPLMSSLPIRHRSVRWPLPAAPQIMLAQEFVASGGTVLVEHCEYGEYGWPRLVNRLPRKLFLGPASQVVLRTPSIPPNVGHRYLWSGGDWVGPKTSSSLRFLARELVLPKLVRRHTALRWMGQELAAAPLMWDADIKAERVEVESLEWNGTSPLLLSPAEGSSPSRAARLASQWRVEEVRCSEDVQDMVAIAEGVDAAGSLGAWATGPSLPNASSNSWTFGRSAAVKPLPTRHLVPGTVPRVGPPFLCQKFTHALLVRGKAFLTLQQLGYDTSAWEVRSLACHPGWRHQEGMLFKALLQTAEAAVAGVGGVAIFVEPASASMYMTLAPLYADSRSNVNGQSAEYKQAEDSLVGDGTDEARRIPLPLSRASPVALLQNARRWFALQGYQQASWDPLRSASNGADVKNAAQLGAFASAGSPHGRVSGVMRKALGSKYPY
eukprot:jgi/Mesvir1/19328/Mv10388-RA.2